MKNLKLYEGFFKKSEESESLKKFKESINKKAYTFIYEIKKEAEKASEKDLKGPLWQGHDIKDIKKLKDLYIKEALKAISDNIK